MDVLPLEHSGCVGCCFSARPQHMHVVADGVPACNQQKNYLFNNYLFIRKTHAIYMYIYIYTYTYICVYIYTVG